MILLDTHIWRWLVNDDQRLSVAHRRAIAEAGRDSLGVSVISCWEIAKAVETGHLTLAIPVEKWIADALNYADIALLELSPRIAIESTQLPKPVHRDPGDQLLIATARVLNLPFLTADAKILSYPHVQTIP